MSDRCHDHKARACPRCAEMAALAACMPVEDRLIDALHDLSRFHLVALKVTAEALSAERAAREQWEATANRYAAQFEAEYERAEREKAAREEAERKAKLQEGNAAAAAAMHRLVNEAEARADKAEQERNEARGELPVAAFWSQRQWEDWSNRLALMLPEEYDGDGAQESLIEDALGDLLNKRQELAALRARIERLERDETGAMDLWWRATDDDWAVPNWAPGRFLAEVRRSLALSPTDPLCDTCSDTGRIRHMSEGDPNAYVETDDQGMTPCPDCTAALSDRLTKAEQERDLNHLHMRAEAKDHGETKRLLKKAEQERDELARARHRLIDEVRCAERILADVRSERDRLRVALGEALKCVSLMRRPRLCRGLWPARVMRGFAGRVNQRRHEATCPFVLMDGGPCRCPERNVR